MSQFWLPRPLGSPGAAAPDDGVYSWEDGSLFDRTEDAGSADTSVFDFYFDQSTPNREDNYGALGIDLPQSFEWDDPDADGVLWPDYWAIPPPIDDNYESFARVEDSSGQPEYLEDQDQLGFEVFPLADDNDVSTARVYDSSDQFEEPDEDFGFYDWQDEDLVLDGVAPSELSEKQPEDEEEPFDFSAGPLSDDAAQVDSSFPLPELGNYGLADEDEFLESESSWPTPDDNDIGWVSYFPDQSEEPEDEDFSFYAGTVCDDNDVAVQPWFPDQSEEQPDEDFSASGSPAPDDVQSDQVFADTADWWPDDVVEEPEGFIDNPLPADPVFEEPLCFCEFPAQAEEPEDEPFGFDFNVTPDDAAPDAVPGGGRHKRRYQIRIGKQVFEGDKQEIERVARELAIAEYEKGNTAAPDVAEVIVPAKKKKAPLVAATEVAIDVRKAYIAAILREMHRLAEEDDEEALIALL
jgi:hypothetical protein